MAKSFFYFFPGMVKGAVGSDMVELGNGFNFEGRRGGVSGRGRYQQPQSRRKQTEYG
jgi:hypothetical protein